MKPITWLALGAAAFVALALFAGKDDLRRFRTDIYDCLTARGGMTYVISSAIQSGSALPWIELHCESGSLP